MRYIAIACISLSLGLGWWAGVSVAQRQRKPQRVTAPKLSEKEFDGVFFEDLASVLEGPRPTGLASDSPASTNALAAGGSSTSKASVPLTAGSPSPSTSDSQADANGWPKLISGATIEDLVKNSKLRLDQIVASQNKYAGGYVEARREFSLQAMMFAIIEQYPAEVRWKRSAAVARESLARMAANAKVSSPQAFKEAKQRVQDLADMLNGSSLEGAASTELAWGNVIDRVPLMQLLEWAQQGNINSFVSSKSNFDQHKEELQRFAELVAVLGKVAIMTDMPDAGDADYRALGQQMIDQAQQVALAVQTDNADLARQAAGQVGQVCAKCHDGYR